MAIEFRVDYQKSRVMFHYSLYQCDGVSDEHSIIEVRHNNINKLPVLRPENVPDEYEVEIFTVLNADSAQIAFITRSWQETSVGRMYEFYGPYHYYHSA